MEKQIRNVLVLSSTQATLQITGATMIAVTGLAGFALAADKSFATVPLTCYVLGSAVTTIPASLLMKSIGRRGGFQIGTAIGMCGGVGVQRGGFSCQLLAAVRRNGGDGHVHRFWQVLSFCRCRRREL